jgi:hypothetical protein
MTQREALAAYNAGPNSKFFQTGDVKDLPDETVKYVQRIITMSGGYITASHHSIRRCSATTGGSNLTRKRLHHLKSKSQE